MGIGMVVWGLASVINWRGIGGHKTAWPYHHRRGDGLSPLPPPGGNRAAFGSESERPETRRLFVFFWLSELFAGILALR